MERTTKIETAKEIFKDNFIGREKLIEIKDKLGICEPVEYKTISYSKETLSKYANDYILILGISLASDNTAFTLNKLRAKLGIDSYISEPCMYNQDWYLKESFASEYTLENKWYLIRKTVIAETKGIEPKFIKQQLKADQKLPSAILCALTFFAYYFINCGKILWKHDYIWCSDVDYNGDQVYVGRYIDPNGINKNGFSIHRHLSVRQCYAVADEVF